MLLRKLYRKVRSADSREFLSGSFWILFGTSFSKLIILISGIIVANILGKIGYGELGIIRSSINMFIVVASVGLGTTGTKYIAQYLDNNKTQVEKSIRVIRIFSVLSAVAVSSLLIFFAEDIATVALEAPHLTRVTQLGGIMLLFSSLNASQIGILYGFRDYKSVALNSLYASLCEISLITVGAYFYGVEGAVAGVGLSFIFYYIINNYSIRKHYKSNELTFSSHLRFQDFNIIWEFAIPAALSSFLVVPVLWYIKVLLVQDSGFGEAALFDIAEQWRMLILFIPLSVGRIILPFLSKYEGNNERDKQKIVIKRMIISNICITVFISLIVLLLAPYILRLYGDDYDNTIPLIVMSFSTVFSSIANVVGQAIASRSKMWTGFAFNLFWAIILVSSTYYLLSLGLAASALAYSLLLSYLIHASFQSLYVRKLLGSGHKKTKF